MVRTFKWEGGKELKGSPPLRPHSPPPAPRPPLLSDLGRKHLKVPGVTTATYPTDPGRTVLRALD